MNGNLFSELFSFLHENPSLVSNQEPQADTDNVQSLLLEMLKKQQDSRITHQFILILSLIIFIIIQMVYVNNMYNNSLKYIFDITSSNPNLSQNYFNLYSQIFEQIKFYITTILCEFIAMMFFIIKWSFSTNEIDINSVFQKLNTTDLINEKKKKRKK